MLNKKLLFLLLLGGGATLYSQSERYYYFYTPEQLEVNQAINRHNYCRSLCIQERDSTFILSDIAEFYPGGVVPSVYEVISQGKAKIKRDRIECYDEAQERVYRFKRVGQRALEALNQTPIFRRGVRVYLHYEHSPKMEFFAYFNPLDLIHSDYWKSGVRNGIFMRHSFPLDNETLYYYKKNHLVDSVRYSFEDPSAIFTRNSFLKRYYTPPKVGVPSGESDVTPVRRKVIIRIPALRRQII